MNYVLSEEEYKALKGQSEKFVDRYDEAFFKEIDSFFTLLVSGGIRSSEECRKRLTRAREVGLKAAKQ